jgi:Uma2 family endonuclease
MAKKKQFTKENTERYGSVTDVDVYDEIVEGVRYEMKPSPVIIHQVVVLNLQDQLTGSCKPNGVILPAPVDVYFDEKNRFIPDIIFISNDNLHIIKPKRIEGTPDLVVEILSPSTSKNDRQGKKSVYERFGVKEYWIVDSHHYTIEQFLQRDGKFELYHIYSFGETLTSPALSCIHINIDEVFEDARRLEERFEGNK